MYRPIKPTSSSSSDKSIIFSGDSSSSEKEVLKTPVIEEETTPTSQHSRPIEISAVHHILPNEQKQKTSYDLHQYYRSEYNAGYKKINTLLVLYEEEVLNFLHTFESISSIKDVVYKYDSIIDHTEQQE